MKKSTITSSAALLSLGLGLSIAAVTTSPAMAAVGDKYIGYNSGSASSEISKLYVTPENGGNPHFVYCFNNDSDTPSDQDSVSKTMYTEVLGNGDNFERLADGETLKGQALVDAVTKVVYNGAPSNASGLKETYNLTDDELYAVTQHAVWAFTDQKNTPTSDMTPNMVAAWKVLVGQSNDVTLKAPPANLTLDLYSHDSVMSFQNLLSTEFVDKTTGEAPGPVVTGTVSVGDYVFEDTNADGTQDATDKPMAGVKLTITGPDGKAVTDVNGKAVDETTTDADGHYSFDNLPVLPAGQHYTVAVETPAGYQATQAHVGASDKDSSTGSEASTDLTKDGDKDTTLDFGFVKTPAPAPATVSVGDYVFQDTNANGIQDSTDKPLSGVTLTITGPDGKAITDVNGKSVAPTTTDADGHYSFENLPTLPAGEHYTVTVTTPDGYTATTPGATTSDKDSSTGSATSTDLTKDGDKDTTLDFGFVKTPTPSAQGKVSVGDYVFEDTNANGVQDSTDKPIAGVKLTITGPDGKAVTDVNGKSVAPTTTDANGHYSFENLPTLPAGEHYTVTVTAPQGYQPTKEHATNADKDSSTGSASSTDLVSNGDSDTTLDFGFVKTPVVPQAPAKVSVGDYVWNDVDRNGKQDATDKPMAGVTLTVTGPNGKAVTDVNGKVVAPTRTDAKGHYSFDNLPTLPAGQHYTVTVTTPTGYVATRAGATSRDKDSSTGRAVSSDLTSNGAQDKTLDFGFVIGSHTVSFRVQYDVITLKTASQVSALAKTLHGTYAYRADVVWNPRTGKVASAPLWAKGVSRASITTMSVSVPNDATAAQVLQAEKAAVAKAYKVGLGKAVTGKVGHVVSAAYLIPAGAWDNRTSWKQGPKTAPQVLVGSAIR